MRKNFLLLALSIAGFFDSAYLTLTHYKNIAPPCEIAKGCETVLTSQFSTIFGIPVAIIGAIYFLFLIFVILQRGWLFRYLKFFAFLGVLASLYFFYTQAFILHAFCQYCILSEVIILGIFILSFKNKK